MKKLFWTGGMLFALFLPAAAQKKIQEVKKTNDTTVVIPFTKYKLKNGLTVIIHEDHSDPLIHVDVTYHVGSNREEIGKSGFAHFFEHMMFQGSEHVGDEQHFKIVTEGGGTMNGTTNRDRTNYFETLPKNQLETALWLEADRMGFLLDSVTQRKFEIQRATVKNERGQNYDNRPYGLVSEVTSKTLYPYGHPYSWLTIGYVEDLDRVDVTDLKRFFMRWYGPNNATLSIGGDVDPKEVLKLVNKYFGPIPSGPKVDNLPKMVPVLEQNRYVSMEDNVRFPMLRLTYPTVPFFHKDEAALDVLAYILGNDKNSVLYQKLEKPGIVYRASCSNSSFELAGEMAFSLMSYPDSSLASINQRLAAILAEFDQKGVTDEDLARAKTSIETSSISSLETVSGKVRQLAFFQTFAGNPDALRENLESYNKVTKEDVMRVFRQYVLNKPAVILSVYPKGKSNLAANDNFSVSKDNFKPGKDQYAKLKYKKAKDKFDRSQRPVAQPDQGGPTPKIWRGHIGPSGIPIVGIENHEVPYVRMMLVVKGGHQADAKYPGKEGLANLTAIMKTQSTYNMSPEALQREMEKYGASIHFYATEDAIIANIGCTKKNLPQTLGLFQEMLLNSSISKEDFDREKKKVLESIANGNLQAANVATNVFNAVVFDSTIKASPVSGTLESVKNITLEDVRSFHDTYFTPSLAYFLVSGDVTMQELSNNFRGAVNWKGPATQLPELNIKSDVAYKPVLPGQAPLSKTRTATKIYLVNKENAAQSEIRIGYAAIPYDAMETYYRLTLMNYPLGGNFNSRLNLNLREDKGWTYGARSSFSGNKYPGAFMFSAGVKRAATDSTVAEVISELKKFRQYGVTQAEIDFTKKALTQAENLSYESNYQKLGYLKTLEQEHLSPDYTKQQCGIINSISADEMNRLSRTFLPVEIMKIVVVGDVKTIRPGLEKLGYEIVLVDENGKTLNK